MEKPAAPPVEQPSRSWRAWLAGRTIRNELHLSAAEFDTMTAPASTRSELCELRDRHIRRLLLALLIKDVWSGYELVSGLGDYLSDGLLLLLIVSGPLTSVVILLSYAAYWHRRIKRTPQ